MCMVFLVNIENFKHCTEVRGKNPMCILYMFKLSSDK
jgi:hypothetical protein